MIWGLTEFWILLALLASASWALSCVLDVCLVEKRIYRQASDGPAVTGLFCLLPALLTTGYGDIEPVSVGVAVVGMLSGIVFLLHMYCYFKALFVSNDGVDAEIMNTLCVLVVPLLAFLALGERLSMSNYVAIAVAGAGVAILVLHQRTAVNGVAMAYLITSVVLASLMMVMQAWVLERTSYTMGVWLFSSAAFTAVVMLHGVRRRPRARLLRMCRRFGLCFVFVELLEMVAVLGSQRATDLSPSVSLVALIECSLPLFLMVFSGLFAFLLCRGGAPRADAILMALRQQTARTPSKLVSLTLIVVAISLVGAN